VRLVVYLPLVISLVAGLGARPLSARLHPRDATWLLTGAGVVLAACTTAALGLLAATVVTRIPVVAGLGHLSAGVLRRDDPAAVSTALIAALALGAAVLAACAMAARRVRAVAAAWREARCLPGDGDVVVVPDREPDAFALPGYPGRVVVTGGMLDALGAREREALLAHERAHLACAHYLFVAAAHLAATASPLLRPLASAVEYAVERWADERAAAVTGDRQLVARAIARAALAQARIRPARRLPAALHAAGSHARRVSLRRAGPVPRRVAALLAPAPGRQALLLGVALVVVAVACISALEAARDLHALLALARAAA
jgi:Zn-dependent protease with chaperone function